MHPLKIQALERDENKCQRRKEDGHICGRTERLTMHHLVPKRKGGKDELANVIIWCWDCHRAFNRFEAKEKKRVANLRKTCKYSLEWKCKPSQEKCATCTRYICDNWPEGFVEALVRLLTGSWTSKRPVSASLLSQ